jgi:hypothetical protein
VLRSTRTLARTYETEITSIEICRGLKLNVHEAEVRQTVIGEVAVRIKHKNIL